MRLVQAGPPGGQKDGGVPVALPAPWSPGSRNLGTQTLLGPAGLGLHGKKQQGPNIILCFEAALACDLALEAKGGRQASHLVFSWLREGRGRCGKEAWQPVSWHLAL
jgi:hypothetical protein